MRSMIKTIFRSILQITPTVNCHMRRHCGPHRTRPALADGVVVAVAGAQAQGSAGAVGLGTGSSATNTGAGADSQPQAGDEPAAVQAQPLAGCEGSAS